VRVAGCRAAFKAPDECPADPGPALVGADVQMSQAADHCIVDIRIRRDPTNCYDLVVEQSSQEEFALSVEASPPAPEILEKPGDESKSLSFGKRSDLAED
jgi:hypothetical protein